MFQIGICVDNKDPKSLRRIKVRTDSIPNKTEWILPIWGGAVNFPVPLIKDQIILFYDNDLYENTFYAPHPTKQFSGQQIGDRQEKSATVNESFEVDLEGKVNLRLDSEADEAQLEASRVVIGTDQATEFIVMATKLKNWINNSLIPWLEDHDHGTGVGPSTPAKSGPYHSLTPIADVSEATIASEKHEVEP